ncbi:polyribonucleotide nucleotidyltransferase [Candidatus Kaiserbacteria bacterium RIFCSPHIGHO2_01_FULL_56_24]|uniref:Polyribonucleotide nucleotidyltransferase n=1 Tax=Candidatus Kaiserbacteria bacterium RIFCSPHIGHO2_01_FULL_56_24 TaxID=1798487 RepID=A0A1F6DAT8_9BACT|nr:MAG: polyribonucleotide nucleotidyltransferase [Candidatus Kaiserbacteria bacterium RIFCSPHIGHO2_01_FULL_56_24]
MQKKEYSVEIGGKTLTAEFNDWADQANGSVLVRYGNSTVLATAVMGSKETALDYFPLSVEYEEKFYAAGAILGSRFMRREGRPSDEAVLSGRIVDRTIRPLFPKGLKRDVQVIISVLSLEDYDPDVLAVTAASLALGTSNIPWNGPVSAVRIGLEDGSDSFILNPTYQQRQEDLPPKARMDLLACGKDGLINMIEVGAREVDEAALEKGLKAASIEIERLQAWQKQIIQERNVAKAAFIPPFEDDAKLAPAFDEIVGKHFASKNGMITKEDLGKTKSDWTAHAAITFPDVPAGVITTYYEHRVDEYVHDLAIKEGKRVDGRKFDEVRSLYAQAGGVSPMIHGTGLFYRGETHVLAALTLGGPGDAQLIDTIEYQESKKRFMLHYNFPPFSVGETGRMGGANRRMIGHGALAEKALRAVLPDKDVFPYTIRIVSECLASNGSTSQATVCAGTLALMDAGVPITKPVAGIAMGMMSDAKAGVYKVLTDIQGPEDHHGDMDFKVAGTKDGVTAVQMDVKVEGVPLATLAEAFAQAKKARMEILETIVKEISAPRADISPRAPKILTLKVKTDQIGLVIGPGGKMINGIRERTGAEDITIEEDGTIFITGKGGAAEAAFKEISDLTREYMPGEKFEGTVTRLMDFGAFVKIGPNTEGLVHVSEVAPFRIGNISEAVKEGDVVPVMLKEIDEKGRYNLSIKAADPEFAARKGLVPSEGGGRDDHGGRRHNTERRHY